MTTQTTMNVGELQQIALRLANQVPVRYRLYGGDYPNRNMTIDVHARLTEESQLVKEMRAAGFTFETVIPPNGSDATWYCRFTIGRRD